MVLCHLLGIQMAVVINDGKMLGLLVKQLLGCLGLQQEVFVHERFHTNKGLKVQTFGNTKLQSAQFCQTTQTTDTAITGVGLLLQVIAHLMSMIRTHNNALLALLLNLEEGLHDLVHRNIAFKVVSLVEVTLGIALGLILMLLSLAVNIAVSLMQRRLSR